MLRRLEYAYVAMSVCQLFTTLHDTSRSPFVISKYWDIVSSLLRKSFVHKGRPSNRYPRHIINSTGLSGLLCDENLRQSFNDVFSAKGLRRPREQDHHAIVASYVCARTTWSWTLARQDQTWQPMVDTFQIIVETWPSASGVALTSIEILPCSVNVESLVLLLNALHGSLASGNSVLLDPAAKFLSLAISGAMSNDSVAFDSGPYSELLRICRSTLESFDSWRDSDPVAHDAALRLCGSFLALWNCLAGLDESLEGTSDALLARWAVMMKLALSHESVSLFDHPNLQ